MSDSSPNQGGGDGYDSLLELTTIGLGILRLRRTTNNKSKQFDDLPNEIIMKIILSKLTWSQLIHLRIVCKRWHSLIHSMAKLKKLLIINFLDEQTNKLKRSFFGKLDFDNCARVNLKMLNPSSASNLEALIIDLFPSVDQIVFNCNAYYPIKNFVDSKLDLLSPKIVSLSITIDDPYISSYEELYCIADHINRLTNLEQLEICGQFASLVLDLIIPIIRESLYHFSFSNLSDYTNQLNEVVVPNFGTNCTRVALDSPQLSQDDLLGWSGVNPTWLAQLTHLQLSVDIEQFDRVAQFLSKNAVSLQVFCFDAKYNMRNTNGTITLLPLTLQAMRHLAHISHLEELELKNVFFESAIRHSFPPFLSVRICTLRIDVERGMECDAFCRILSRTFPYVQHLNISLMHSRGHFRQFFYHGRDYLAYFRALRTRNFVEELRPYD